MKKKNTEVRSQKTEGNPRRGLGKGLPALCFIAGTFAGTLVAQTVVVGTGDPDIDIAAVQTAVDRGGAVTLRGRFSFDNPPTRHGTLPDLMATILVSRK